MGYLAKYLTATFGASIASYEKFAFETWLLRVAPGRDDNAPGKLDLRLSTFADLNLVSVNGQAELDIMKRILNCGLGMQGTINQDKLLNLQYTRQTFDSVIRNSLSLTATKVIQQN